MLLANLPQNAPHRETALTPGLDGPHVPPCGAVVLAVPPPVPISGPCRPNWQNCRPRSREDMRAFYVEPNAIKQDEIAARQLHALVSRAYQRSHERKLRLSDVKEMFAQMRDHA